MSNTSVLKGTEKYFIIGLIVWLFAQLIRFIAIPLIQSVNNGIDAPGWLYPAILDVFAAVFAIPLILLVWKYRSFVTWTLAIVYFTMSITDHIGALSNLYIIGEPIAFLEMNGGRNPYTAPIIQTILDIVFFVLLLIPKYRNLFFKI